MSSDTMTLVSEGERVIVGIELPKNPDSPSRKVSFAPEGNQKYAPAGWIYADVLGDITIGTLVEYRIEKNAAGFNKITHIAPVAGKAAGPDAGIPPQGPAARDDVQGGGASVRQGATTERGSWRDAEGVVPLPPGAEPPEDTIRRLRGHDVPNSDTQRFESYAFLAACGMVDLAYEELTDAKEAGVIDAVKSVLVKSIAGMLLNAADQAQRALVGRCDRSAMSHTRARGAVRTALRSYPVSAELTNEPSSTNENEWGDKLTRAATVLLQVAASL